MVASGPNGVLLCRYFERAGKERLASSAVVSSPERARSLARRFNRLRPATGQSGRCSDSLGNRIDVYFGYPDGSVSRLAVVLGGCGLAVRGTASGHLTPSLRELLLELTSRR